MAEGTQLCDGRIVLHAGDCREVMKGFADNSIDAVVTDPPYHLTQGDYRSPLRASGDPAQRGRVESRGFMGKQWDGGDIAFQAETWAEALRVLKPGGHMIAFGGTRTYHRLVCAIEDAGFEIRDSLAWIYGSGFPKSHDVSKGIDKASGALKPRGHGFNTAGQNIGLNQNREMRSDHPD